LPSLPAPSGEQMQKENHSLDAPSQPSPDHRLVFSAVIALVYWDF